jgi:HlyD family secretion protein
MSMDVRKPQLEVAKRRRRRLLVAGAAAVVVAAVVLAAGQLGRAAPSIERSGLWIDTVKQGPMIRELQGVGELVPDDDASRWVAAELDGRIDRKLLEEGARVSPDTVLLQLSNPDVEQAAVAADLALEAAEAGLASLEETLQGEFLGLRSNVAAIEAELANAAIQAKTDASLARDGLLSDITAQQSDVRAKSLETRVRLERDRLARAERSISTRLAVQRSEVENRRTVAELKRRDVASMTARAGMAGVLQDLVVEVGQRVTRSANLARIVDPARLKAQLRIPEAQTDDLRLGLTVKIDTHSGVVPGNISRIAPSAENGTVKVDVKLQGDLPRGARPDMTIDGTVEIERLDNVRHMGRPASGSSEGAVTLFKVSADATRAEPVTVRLGRASANRVQIVAGELREGDRIVLSDTSAWGKRAVRLR